MVWRKTEQRAGTNLNIEYSSGVQAFRLSSLVTISIHQSDISSDASPEHRQSNGGTPMRVTSLLDCPAQTPPNAKTWVKFISERASSVGKSSNLHPVTTQDEYIFGSRVGNLLHIYDAISERC